jgi:hypothetical protein
MQMKLAEAFFIIRYREKGPHIRLRFKGNPVTLEEKLKPAILAHFEAYFAAHPSLRIDPAWGEDAPEAQKWFPNNSVQFVEYKPETERYGGPTGLLIAERQFQASSEAVLAILQESNGWDYNRAMGVAIQLHLGFAFAQGMDLSETTHFFSRVFENWLPRAYFSYQSPQSREECTALRENVLAMFRRTYQQQKVFLLPLFKTIWEALETFTEFEQAWYNQWLLDMSLVRDAVQQAQDKQELTTPGVYNGRKPEAAFSAGKQQRWAIYDSYVHMTNNRLGIMNQDESYLAYLIKKGLAEMALS